MVDWQFNKTSSRSENMEHTDEKTTNVVQTVKWKTDKTREQLENAFVPKKISIWRERIIKDIEWKWKNIQPPAYMPNNFLPEMDKNTIENHMKQMHCENTQNNKWDIITKFELWDNRYTICIPNMIKHTDDEYIITDNDLLNDNTRIATTEDVWDLKNGWFSSKNKLFTELVGNRLKKGERIASYDSISSIIKEMRQDFKIDTESAKLLFMYAVWLVNVNYNVFNYDLDYIKNSYNKNFKQLLDVLNGWVEYNPYSVYAWIIIDKLKECEIINLAVLDEVLFELEPDLINDGYSVWQIFFIKKEPLKKDKK